MRIGKISDCIVELVKKIEEMVASFYQRDEAKGICIYKGLLDDLLDIVDELSRVQQTEDIGFDITTMNQLLEQVMGAISDKDYILLADLFVYELVPQFKLFI